MLPIKFCGGGILQYQSCPKDKTLNHFSDSGTTNLDGIEFEVEFKVKIRASKSSFFETNKLSGLRGVCEIFADGDSIGRIKMQSGRLEYSILGGLIDNAVNQIFEGEPDTPDIDFSSSSNKAEWSKIINVEGTNYKVLIKFVFRESSDRLKYYVFVEKI